MHTLRVQDRDASMVNLVSFHGVPMPRMLAFAIRDIENHGAPVDIFSADRTTAAIAEHNRQFGTHLSAQQALIDAHARDPRNHAAANPLDRTSHCYFADDTVAALMHTHGHPCQAGDKLPRWALGLDLSDKGKIEDVRRFLNIAHLLGYRFYAPYMSGSEKHHVVCVSSVIPVLEARNQISKNRHA